MRPPLDSIYITYWSLCDPLCQSQSLPYLRSLTSRGYRVGLITFEQPRWRMTEAEAEASKRELASAGIEWVPLRYHKRPAVLSTLYDIAAGSVKAAWLARRSQASIVHGRASVSVAIATAAARLAKKRLFVDADGPLSQEYVDAGVWPESSLGHRLTAWGEQRAMKAADIVAVLTDHRRREVAPWLDETPIYVLPCAVDLDRFRPLPEARDQVRAELGLRGTTFVYAGKAGGWYDTEEMVAFVEAAREVFDTLTLLVLTRDGGGVFEDACRASGVELVVRDVPPERMPEYLSAADAGLCFLQPFPSKLACSPIKVGEYLGCGLPVVCTSGCGDYDELVRRERVGVVVENSRRSSYPSAAQELASILADPGVDERCREAARRAIGLAEVVAPRYAEIYEQLTERT